MSTDSVAATSQDQVAPVRRVAATPLLEIEDLHVEFTRRHSRVHAVNGVSLSLSAGECVALVGESGSGKSATAASILRLLPANAAMRAKRICFDGLDLATCDRKALRKVRGSRISMIFQDPSSYLNPVLTVGWQLAEVVHVHDGLSRAAARARAEELLSMVGIPAARRRLDDYPHQFSGGMRQRAMIAMAIACSPSLLIADEPTTALDVTVQAQIMQLLQTLQSELGMAMLLVTHDLRLVGSVADRVLLMYGGEIVEEGQCADLIRRPLHPYTVALWAAVPRIDLPPDTEIESLEGIQRELTAEPRACVFLERCPCSVPEVCGERRPDLDDPRHDGHRAACFFPVGSEGGQS